MNELSKIQKDEQSELAEPRILYYTLMVKKTYAYISKSVNVDYFNGQWLAENLQKRSTSRASSNEVDLDIFNIVLIEFW